MCHSIPLRLASLTLLALLLAPGAALLADPPDDGRAGTVIGLMGTALVSPAGHDRWTVLSERAILMPGDRVRTLPRGANAVEIALAGGGTLVLGPGGLVEVAARGEVRLLSGEMEHARTPGATPVFRRARDGTETTLDAAPRWLTGYRSSTTSEWMGSLVAEVDGRNVALSIGYHKVEVVIRDQIAETTVEESFVNGTGATLEGAFTFPLPADASISGFGMWIGEELAMADIVERGRAREIYEDIRRRRKDPGLLEWSGGNLFKARVFPIFPHSEKRVKVRYTQVLPQNGTDLRYTYALRSEMLRAHPLRALSIGVSIDSALPIAGVSCPSHPATIRKTPHQARVDYDAAEVTPERDFEVVLGLAAVAPVTVIPHRRGPDGYFLLLLSPPDPAAAGFRRGLAPEGDPVDLVLLADTSGSMDGPARAAQAAFVEALLSLLGPKDTFRLATADLGTRWFREEPVAVSDEAAADALAFLAARDSLGWTDLDRTLADAAERAGGTTHVVYLGDGIGTAGDPDPPDLIRRIGLLATGAKGTFHAVATGSSFEKGVLEAIAAIGGGSVRDGASDPVGAASRLLAEIARPAVKDLAVSFSGVRTARVYPGRLPNLPAGAQQILLGRFLPSAGGTKGEVLVTGTLDGAPVRYVAPFTLEPDATGNDFLPRLWARRHVDGLLREALTPAVREEIVSLSAEFAIMTPLTSFLVLESDADREHYGVTRRVAMRDGEGFFAAAKDRVSTEILRQAMREAGTWRKTLRARALAEIRDLGRSLVPLGVAWGGFGPGSGGRYRGPSGETADFDVEIAQAAEIGDPVIRDAKISDHDETDSDLPVEESLGREDFISDAPFEGPSTNAALDTNLRDEGEVVGQDEGLRLMGLRKSPVAGGPERASEDRLARILPRTGPDTGSAAASILSLFPRLPPAPEEPKVAPGPAWPAEVEQILAALDRTAEVDAFDGGLQVVQTTGRPHPLRDEWQSVSRTRALFAGKAWFMARANRGSPPEEAFCRGDQRAVFRPDLRLGRMRPAADADHDLRFSGAGVFLLDFVHHRRDGEAEVVSRDGAIVTLRFRRPAAKAEWVLVVDRDRRVVLEQRVYIDGRLELKLVWSDWTETGGLPFAGLHEEYDGDGAIAVRTRTTATARPAAEVSEEIGRLVEGTGDGLFLAAVDRAVPDAKRAAGGGTATFADRFALVLDHAGRQQWDEALAAWVAAKALAAGKPGAEILEAALLAVARRGEALLELLTRLAAGVAGRPWAVRPGLADTIRGFGERVLGGHEMLGLTRALRAALPEAGEDFAFAARLYDRRIAGLLASLDRPEEALAIRRALVDAAPDDPETWAELVDAYSGLRRPGDALATAEAALAREAKWTDDEARPLHQRRADHRWQERDLPGFLAAVDLWIARKPRDEEVFERRLAGLLFSGRIDDVDRAILAEIATGPGDSPAPADLARFAAAVDVALGSAWNLWTNRLDERFVKPLGDAALRLARRSDAVGHQANRILGNWRFRQQDEYWRIIAGLREDLFSAEALREMSHDRLQRTAGLFDLGRSGCTDEEFARLSTAILARIGAAEEPAERAQFGDLLLSFLDRRGDAKGAADLLRQRLAAEPDTTRNAVAVRLVERLLRVEWTRSVEDEVLSLLPVLLPKVAPEEVDPQAESRQWAGIARLVADGLLSARVEAALGPPAEREKLPRAELAARRRAARQAARADLADRFFARAVGGPERLAPWLAIEALCLRAEAGGDAAPLEGIARELLLSPPSIPAPELAPVFLERATLVLEYLATRRDAAPALVERVLALARERAEAADGETREDRRYGLFRLLLALDRPDDLVALLRSFAGEGRVESFYRTALAYLLAERGSLAEAAEELEAVARAGELGAAGFSTLAGWHLALGEDERRSRALDRMLGETDERQLGRRIRQELGRVREPGPDGVPESLDPEIFCVERILLGKATRPADYLNGIRQLYEATKDLRALAALADGIVGHSPEAIYPYLTKAWTILKVVHEEATLDEVAARVRARAERASTPTDRRGLLYLAALVFRRAAEVRNRPEVHAEQALPALREAFPEEWLPGEPRLLARFLASLGAIPDAALAAEHLRQLAAVHAIAGEATWDGLAIAAEHAAALDAYGRHDEAIDMLTAALDAVRAASGGRLPPATFVHAETLLRWLTAMGRFAAGEEWLLRERGRQPGEEERAYLTLRLLSLHSHALRDRGRISLGAGEALFTAAFDLSEQAALALPAAHVHEVLERLCQLTRVAAAERIAGAPDRLAAFARERSRPALDRAPDREQFLWLAMASAVHDGGRPEVALSLLVEKLEQDPEWYPRAGRDGWARFADRIAHWRAEQEPEGDFADRLAKIVVSKLVEELGTGENHGHGIYHDDSECFWPERAAEFAAAARRVVELRPDSPSVVLRVASYLWVGLSLRSEAVDVLTRLDGRGMLPDHGRLTLALWLMEIARHAEAVPHLKTLLAGNPDRLDVRSPLVVCFHELGRDGEGTALADETEHLLREQKRWDFRAIVTLAEACFTCGYHDRAARWFEEAIRLAERRRMPPGSLSPWYGKLGRSLSALGRVEEAVDAATAAVVSWGRDVIGRQRALDDLTRTLGGLPDLDGFVAGFAKKAAETGLDAPILRKRIGVVYLGRGAYAKAAEALRAARELAPMDREVHDLLVRCADLSGDGEAALAALAESLSHAPSDLSLMAALAARLENAGRSGDAERARTNYVEAEPLSAAGHSRLAAEREQARRFEEALVQRRLAVRLREFDPEVWFELVATLRAAGRPDEAKEILTRMMARPWSSEAGDVRSRIAAALR